MKIDISHISKLANIPLTSDKKNEFEKQLSAILDHFKKMSELPTSEIEETSQITGLSNITSPDEIKPSLSKNEALKNAKKSHNGMFVVPAILEDAIKE